MQVEEGTFTGSGGIELYFQSWLPSVKPKAVMVIVHGLSDHCGRYAELATFIQDRGVAVYGYDQRGHGRSPGRRGHVDSFSQFRDDLHAFVQFAGNNDIETPKFLLGQSLGGLIVLDYALHYPDSFDGVIALSPHLSDPPLSPVLKRLVPVLGRVWPTFSVKGALEVAALTRVDSVVEAYKTDPLVHNTGSVKLAQEAAATVKHTQDNATHFRPPLLILHGDADRITRVEGSRQFIEKVPGPDKTYIEYSGGYHECLNDLQRERVMMDVAHWMDDRIRVTTEHHENVD
jgi:alpha-beta hydrolase superfamily lysophospholipase